jgi:murein DD-endopeptidase MepM/ murein hydrolase activator NlpD
MRAKGFAPALAVMLLVAAAAPGRADDLCADSPADALPALPATGAAQGGGPATIHPGEWSRAAPAPVTAVFVRAPSAPVAVAGAPRITTSYDDRIHSGAQPKIVYAPGVRPPAAPAPIAAALPALPGGLALPIAGAPMTSGFGWRIHPVLGGRRFHNGIDLGAPRGTPVRAAAAGTVATCGRRSAEGLFVALRHGGRVETLYAHLAGFPAGLRRGQPVPAGTVIGYVGSTGLSTGPHLFYELVVDGRPVDPLGPGAAALAASGPGTRLASDTR